MLDDASAEEVLENLHWRPSREEWLANAILELGEEIRQLELKKSEYEDEWQRIQAKK